MSASGYIFDIRRFTIHDGPGIRVTVFFQGCPLACRWCHNPESLRQLGSPGAREMSVAEVVAEAVKDRVFMEESGGGVTFSGGEPLMQPEFLRELVRACRVEGLPTAVDTSGFAEADVFDAVMPEPDLFLYDLKLMESRAHRRYTGCPNGPILRNFRRLAKSGRPVIVRVPVIPGRTDGDANLDRLSEFVLATRPDAPVNLLPYHRLADRKYERLGRCAPMAGVEPPGPARMEQVRARLAARGLRVTIGAAT